MALLALVAVGCDDSGGDTTPTGGSGGTGGTGGNGGAGGSSHDPYVETLAATLPSPRAGISAIWDGTNVYVFGGDGAGTAIARFNPATEEVTTIGASLPNASFITSAAYDGTHAFVFGGMLADGSTSTNEITRFDPATETILDDPEATKLAQPEYRDPWKFPEEYL